MRGRSRSSLVRSALARYDETCTHEDSMGPTRQHGQGMTGERGAREMEYKSLSPASAVSPILPLTAGAFAIGIFLIDTFTPLDIAIAVLYVIVVLIAANFMQRRGV